MTDEEIISKILCGEIPATAAPQADIEARADSYLADAIARTRRDYFFANCPKDYREFDICRPELQGNRAQLARLLSWRPNEGEGKGLIASGETGRGKTRAMFALCRRLLCEEARDVAIWHAKDWFFELEQNLRYGKDEASDFVRRTAARKILFIDDYGQEAIAANRQEWAQGWFFRLLDLRIGNRLPLLITTNLGAKQMAEGSREISAHPLIRRILELAEPIKFT